MDTINTYVFVVIVMLILGLGLVPFPTLSLKGCTRARPKRMRPSIKILKLPPWVGGEYELKLLGEDSLLGKHPYHKLKPRFHRDGLYFDRRASMCWMEHRGEAWTGDLQQFQYELALEDFEILSPRELAALRTVYRVTLDRRLKAHISQRLYRHRERDDLRRLRFTMGTSRLRKETKEIKGLERNDDPHR